MISFSIRNFIYQLIYRNFMKKSKNARWPTLETVIMVRDFVRKNSGEYTRRQLWLKLPKKVMWQTFVLIIDYLMEDRKVGADRKGYLIWIYNPKLMRYLKKHPELEWHRDEI
jgi:hypothetical protein